jgi:hypothetical protein
MDYSLINSKIGAEHQILFLNRSKIEGIQSVQASQNLGLDKLSYAGIGNKTLNYIPKSEQSNTVQINRLLINSEPFLEFVTGSRMANIYVLREQNDLINNYCLLSGYFTDFQCEYSIGNVATCSTTFNAVGDAGKINTGNMYLDQAQDLAFIQTGNFQNTGGYLIPSIGTISLNIDTFQTNRLQSYQLNITSNKVAKYIMGQKHPKSIENLSSDINCSFSFELGNAELSRLRNFPQSGVVKNLSITIKDYKTEEQICQYNFNNLNLTAENYSVSSNENVLVNVSFTTKIYA